MKENRVYHLGKGVKNDERRTSMTGAPNTNLDTREKKSGKLIQRRKYDKKGNAYKDLDVADKNHKKYDHVHDIKNKIRSKNSRKPTKKEQRELNKAKKKRRFWLW